MSNMVFSRDQQILNLFEEPKVKEA